MLPEELGVKPAMNLAERMVIDFIVTDWRYLCDFYKPLEFLIGIFPSSRTCWFTMGQAHE
jgi:hypothetical protein